jgi:hypothetical protein
MATTVNREHRTTIVLVVFGAFAAVTTLGLIENLLPGK